MDDILALQNGSDIREPNTNSSHDGCTRNIKLVC